MLGNVSPQDFTYAKEVKMGMYSAKQAPPPGAAVSARKMKSDHRAAPEYGERVPYVIMEGEPGLKQVDRAIAPNEFLADP
jgi:DNA polymerase zeta